MDQIMRLRDVLFDYISPAAKRRRVFGPIASSSNTEDLFISSKPVSFETNTDTSVAEISYQSHLPLSQNRNKLKRTREDFEDEIDSAEVDSDLSDSQSPPPIDKLIYWVHQNPDPEDYEVTPESMPEDDYKSIDSVTSKSDISDRRSQMDYKIDKREMMIAKVQEYLHRQSELALRKSDVSRAKASREWHPDELFLFERLTMRGFEILLPKCWKTDFPTLPHTIFAEYENERTFVNTNFTSSSYGIKALQSLLNLGVRVRDNLLTGAPTNKLIAREIHNYIKWSERDGKYSKMRFLPVLTTVIARPKQTMNSLSAAINSQMNFLARRHRETLVIPETHDEQENSVRNKDKYVKQPPLLYGVIVAHTVIIFVTLDSANEDATVKHMQHFDFRDQGADAWIGFAIAILVIVARNYIMSIKKELEDDESDLDVDL
ncbi:hypothetical protein Golomagni_04664 [Golovinomyces magnicellulatus]|nr:hypothetical protein Golomagni_04664 [Golovinomyces magnicellulatus]